MEQELKCNVAVIGGGPAGCACAYFLQDKCEITLFDSGKFLRTILPTGGGRCNLAHAEFNFKNLAQNYPRGEKFLYSIFSKFGTSDTIDMFKKLGIETYTQNDKRIFPISNSSSDVREKFLNSLNKTLFAKEKVSKIEKLNNDFKVTTDKAEYLFNKVIIAIGGHSSYDIIKSLGHTVIEPKKALVGLKTAEDLSSLAGISINYQGEDILFTHKGISGPYIYKISSIKARDKFPYKLHFDFLGDISLQEKLNKNPHKNIKNLLSEYIPKAFAEFVLNEINIPEDTKCHQINGKTRDLISNKLKNYTVTIIGTSDGGEVVTCGGVNLKEIDSKTMESKIVNNLYFVGEVLDIDGFCGGFNLQNCWSTAYVASTEISKK